MNEPEKMTGKKLLKLPPSLLTRLTRVAANSNEDASEIVRRGTIAELDRLESINQVEKQRMEKLRALAAAQGGDVDAVLDKMLREVTEPSLPLGTAAAA